MKRLTLLTLILVLVFAMNAFAAVEQGNPMDIDLTADVEVELGIGPYASVMAQRLEYDHAERVWGWINFLGWKLPAKRLEHYWDDKVEPRMDFGEFSGQAEQSKFTDSNGFVVETNTALTLTFSGVPLTHTLHEDSKILTTYWAFTTAGQEPVWPVENWKLFPEQITPKDKIGFFGEGSVPRYTDGRFSHTGVLDGILHVLGVIKAKDLWPKEGEVVQNLPYTGITTNGIYAFQVFGFASTDAISSQREGDYVGKIILTVSK